MQDELLGGDSRLSGLRPRNWNSSCPNVFVDVAGHETRIELACVPRCTYNLNPKFPPLLYRHTIQPEIGREVITWKIMLWRQIASKSGEFLEIICHPCG